MKKRGYLFALLAAFCFAWQGILTKQLFLRGVTSLDVIALVFISGAIAINGVAIGKGRGRIYKEGWKHKKVLLPLGGLAFAVSALLFLSYSRIDVGIASMLLYFNPVFVCLFFIVTKIRKVSLINKVAVGLAIVGSILALNVFHGGERFSLLGIGLALLAGLAYAAYSLVYDLKGKNIPLLTVMTITTTVAAILGILFNPHVIITIGSLSLISIVLVLCTGILSRLVPLLFMCKGISAIGAEKATVVLAFELPITILLAFLFLGEKMNGIQLMGIGAIVTAIILLQREGK